MGQRGGGGGGSSLTPVGGTVGLAPLATAAQVVITYTPGQPAGGGGAGGDAGSGGVDGGEGGGGSGAGATGGGTVDRKAPLLTGLLLSPTSFSAANSGPSVVAAAVGTRVIYRLSESAATKFTLERAANGRRKGARCLITGKGKPCTRYVKLPGSVTHRGTAGLNSLKFMGRLLSRALPRASYRLVAVATDAAGNRSKPVRRPFRIR